MSHSFKDLADGLPTQQFGPLDRPTLSEPDDLAEEARDIQDYLLRYCREGIRKNGGCRPVVAALVGLELQIFHPEWGSPDEKAKEFHYINEYLEDLDPSIVVAALPGRYGQEDSPDPAIIFLTRTRQEETMKIYPYRVNRKDVSWLDTIEPESYESNILRVPHVD